jgi:protein required for attachment to host cells
MGAAMNVRIVVADERKAMFYDCSRPTEMQPVGSVENPTGGMKDTELETDRAGRRFGGASGVSHGQGGPQGHHHGVDGERSTERHELTMFAKQVGQKIDADRIGHKFDKLVLVAPPKMLGLLRQSLPTQSQSMLAGEVPKDLARHPQDAILNAIPRDMFFQ